MFIFFLIMGCIFLILLISNIIVYKQYKNPIMVKTLGALYPSKDIIWDDAVNIYMDELKMILKDNRITNIAISAPYGIGKSSVLESFFEKRKFEYPFYVKITNSWIRFINQKKQKFLFSASLISEIDDYDFINIPNFFSDNIDTKDLQQKIIEQLLFKANYKRFPYSKIKRINAKSPILNFLTYILIISFILPLIYLYLNFFQAGINFFEVFDQFNYIETLSIIYSLLGLSICIYLLFKKIIILFSKSTINGKGTLGPFELSTSNEQNSINAFNIYSEELIYYFKRSRQKYIIFEDLDRFENPEIFQELRELNLSLNKRFPKIVFIYSLQDKIFKHNVKGKKDIEGKVSFSEDSIVRQKAKFFDYVIPIFPNTSFYNSWLTINEELNKYPELEQGKSSILPSEEFLKKIGYFLKDKRMIILIVKEYRTYINILLKISDGKNFKLINPDTLFGIITYKNYFPDDFEKIGYGNSFLNKIFNNPNVVFTSIFKLKKENLERIIDDIERTIQTLKDLLVQDISYILNVYYIKVFNYFEKRSNYTRYFLIDSEKYFENDAIDFFTRVSSLPDDTLVELREDYPHHAIKEYKISDFYTCFNERESIKQIVKNYSKEKFTNDQINIFENELLKKKKELRELRTNIYNSSIATLIMQNIDDLITLEVLSEEMMFIKQNDIVQFLLTSNCLDVNLFQYVSPIFYGKEDGDSLFIQKVLSDNVQEDYELSNVQNTIDELNFLKVPFYGVYSSDVLISLVTDYKSDDRAKDIIETIIKKNDFNFFSNLIYKTHDNSDAFISILKLFSEKNESFIKNIGLENKGIAFRIGCFIIDNFLLVKELLDEIYKTILKYILVNEDVYLELLMYGYLKKKEAFFDENRELLVLKDISFIELREIEPMDVIFKYGFYDPNKNNFSYINKYYDLKNSFIEYKNLCLTNNVEVIYVKEMYEFFFDMYYSKTKLSYKDFESLISNYMNKDEYLNKFQQIDTELEVRERKLIELFSAVVLIEKHDMKYNEKILKALHYENYLETEKEGYMISLEKLLESSKLFFSEKLYQLVSFHNMASEFILSLENLDGNFYKQRKEFIENNMSEKDKLIIIKNTKSKEELGFLCQSLDGNIVIWENLYNLNFFDDVFIDRILKYKEYLKYESLYSLFKFAEMKNKYIFLELIFKSFPKQLPISDFENIIELSYVLSFKNGASNTHWDIQKSGIDKKILDVLEKYLIITYKRKDNTSFIVRKGIKNFFLF